VWLYLALAFSKLNDFVSVNQTLRLYVKGSSADEQALLGEISQRLREAEENSMDHYEKGLR
jgi:hypothetical protein